MEYSALYSFSDKKLSSVGCAEYVCYNLELIGNLENLFLEDFLHWSILYYILLVTKNYYLLVVQSMFRYNLD
mgnify:CR=1 FL=1